MLLLRVILLSAVSFILFADVPSFRVVLIKSEALEIVSSRIKEEASKPHRRALPWSRPRFIADYVSKADCLVDVANIRKGFAKAASVAEELGFRIELSADLKHYRVIKLNDTVTVDSNISDGTLLAEGDLVPVDGNLEPIPNIDPDTSFSSRMRFRSTPNWRQEEYILILLWYDLKK
jgi:hypothetical protein